MSALTDLFTNIANAIRAKTGSSESIVASDFPTEIANIETTPNLQNKSVEITTNTTTTIQADQGYDGLGEVAVTTNVPSDPSEYMDNTFAGANYQSQAGAWFNYIKKLYVDNISGTSAKHAFSGFKGTKITFNPNIDTSSITSMEYMFGSCSNLTSIENLDKFNTSNVTIMKNMFVGVKIARLDLKNFDMSSCTNIELMFSALRDTDFLDIRTFDFSTITTTTNMFGSSGTRMKTTCEVIVKDNDAKTFINTNFSFMTNVKTVEEYEQQNS